MLDLSKLRFTDNFRFVKWLYSFLSPLSVVDKHHDPTVQRLFSLRRRFAQKAFLREVEDKRLRGLCEEVAKKDWPAALTLMEDNLDELFEEHFVLPQIRTVGLRKHTLLNKCGPHQFSSSMPADCPSRSSPPPSTRTTSVSGP